METAVAWIGLFSGLVFCLTGFAVRRIWAACSCAAAGIGAGLALGTVWQNPAAPAIACVLLGGLLAWGGYQLERAGTAAACGVTGFAAGLLILQCFGNVQWLYALIPAAIGAGSALFRRRPAFLASAAFGGALAAVLSLFSLLTDRHWLDYRPGNRFVSGETAVFLLFCTLLIAAVGLSTQLLLLRRRERLEAAAQEAPGMEDAGQPVFLRKGD